ncbi:MAG: hypothetical protein DWQ10_17250 [Calditrichaeota bacterium]|nr:MAG: hypothetical protein DWQ10_17250 [Calditrichota bacterium]
MNDSGTDYIHRTRDWTVRNMVATYLSLCARFRKTYENLSKPEDFPHETLSDLAEMLFTLKEDAKLIYKPIVRTSSVRKQKDHRIKPDKSESDFLVIIGRLYHKLVVTRELKYLFDNYDALSRHFMDSKNELVHNIETINSFLEKSLPSLLSFLRYNSNNIKLLSFLIEIDPRMKMCLGIRGPELFRSILNDDNIHEKYILAGKYFFESGWYDDSRNILKKVLRKDPKNEQALAILDKLENISL